LKENADYTKKVRIAGWKAAIGQRALGKAA
jgi:hypothetical protein